MISKYFRNFQIFYRVRKKVFSVFATSTSSDLISSFFNKAIFSLIYFSQKETVLQSAKTFCYQQYSLYSILQNVSFFLFREEIHKSFFVS